MSKIFARAPKLTSPVFIWTFLALIFLLAAIWLTWPLVKFWNLGIVGDGTATDDGPFFLWNLWWFKKAILSWQDPFFTNFVYYPARVNLTLHTPTLTSGFTSLLLQKCLGLAGSLNVLLLASIVATALGMVALVRYLTRSWWAGVVAAVAFTFSPFFFAHLRTGHYNLVMLWPFPLIVLFFLKSLRERVAWPALVFALLVLIQSYLDNQIALFAALAVLIIFIVEMVHSPKTVLSYRQAAKYLLMVVLVGGLFVLPYLAAVNGFWHHRLLSPTYNNGDAQIIFGANPLNPWWGKNNLLLTERLIGAYRENTISLGRVVLFFSGLSMLFIRRRLREKLVFLSIALVGLVLALGPNLQVGGHVFAEIKLPFYYLGRLPLLDLGVVPTRFILLTQLALAILAGLSIADLEDFLGRRWLAGLVALSSCVVILLGSYSGAMPVREVANSSPLLVKIGAEPSYFTVLPVLPGPGDVYDQTIHRKKIVSGSLGRRIHDYYQGQYAGVAGIKYLINYKATFPAPDDLDREKVYAAFADYYIKYIVLDKTTKDLETQQRMKKYLSGDLGLPVWGEDSLLVVYETRQ